MIDRKEQIAGLIDNLRAVYKGMVKFGPSFLNELNITYAQMIILGLVRENEGISVKNLAATLGITSSAATQQVNNLVKRGYLVREESDIDRRLVRIRLTGAMDKQVEILEARLVEQFAPLLDTMTGEELSQYCLLTGKIASHILQM
jgi:DNA-binding MarR family transcriptional regulator